MSRPRSIDRERVEELIRSGRTNREVAAELRCCLSAVSRVRAEIGIATPVQAPLSEDVKARMGALLDDGCSYKEVARTLGVGAAVVAKYFPGRGWTYRQGGEHGFLLRSVA